MEILDLTSYLCILPLLTTILILGITISDVHRKRSMDKRVDEMAASYGLKRMKGESTSDLCDRISDRHDADKIFLRLKMR